MKTSVVPNQDEVFISKRFDGRVWVDFRRQSTRKFQQIPGMSIPTKSAMEMISRHSTSLLEIGAGSGFFTKHAQSCGINIVATCAGRQDTRHFHESGKHAAVELLTGAEAIEKYPDRDVLLLMPEPEAKWPIEIFDNLAPGRKIYFWPDFALNETHLNEAARHHMDTASLDIFRILASKYRLVDECKVRTVFDYFMKWFEAPSQRLFLFERLSYAETVATA